MTTESICANGSNGASLNADGEGNGRTVCVTGANGFIGSWIVSALLERGYNVRGTVRSPDNQDKTGHLWQLKGADKRLKLIKADIMDYDSIAPAVAGCDGVIHNACPVLVEMNDPQTEMIDPAVKGVQNVLEACAAAGVRRVIHVSSYTTCMYSRGQDSSKVPDESCWADSDFHKSTGYWYVVAKIAAEKAAWELADKRSIDLISVLPGMCFGPMLQKEVNASCQLLYGLFVGLDTPYTYLYAGPVDVRDVADSMVLLFETPSASGRYLCCESFGPWSDIMQMIGQLYPRHNIPQAVENTQPWLPRCNSPSKKLEALGFVFRPRLETFLATLQGFEERGLVSHDDSGDGTKMQKFIPKLVPEEELVAMAADEKDMHVL